MSDTPEINVDSWVGNTTGCVAADSTEGLDHVSISLRFDARTGPGRALLLLARAAVEVVVHARQYRRPA